QGIDTTNATRLFAPRDAYRTAYGFAGETGVQGFGGAPVGQNPPPGAVMYFYLANAPDSANPVKLEIVNADGQVVRTFSARKQPSAPGAAPVPALRVNKGLNRVVWD